MKKMLLWLIFSKNHLFAMAEEHLLDLSSSIENEKSQYTFLQKIFCNKPTQIVCLPIKKVLFDDNNQWRKEGKWKQARKEMLACLGYFTMTFILCERWKKPKYGYAYGGITIKKILACLSIGLLERNLVGLAIDYTSTLKLEKQLEQAKQLKLEKQLEEPEEPEELGELETELNNINKQYKEIFEIYDKITIEIQNINNNNNDFIVNLAQTINYNNLRMLSSINTSYVNIIMQYQPNLINSKENLFFTTIKDNLLKTMNELYHYNKWVIEQLKNKDENNDQENQTIKKNLEDCDKLYQEIVILYEKINKKLKSLFKMISHATKEQSLRWHKFNILNKMREKYEYLIKKLPFKYHKLSSDQTIRNICFELFDETYNELEQYINKLPSK